MVFTEAIIPPAKGHFHLEVRRNGAVIELVDEPNLVVDAGKFALAHLLGGAVSGNSVSSIGFGTSGTSPVLGNTALTSSFTKAVDSVSYPAGNQVQFNFSLATGEANGKGIMEFGLLTSSGILFARKTRASALTKESDISFSGAWIISF